MPSAFDLKLVSLRSPDGQRRVDNESQHTGTLIVNFD